MQKSISDINFEKSGGLIPIIVQDVNTKDFQKSNVDAALAASIFHYDTHGVTGVKKFLKGKKIPVRL